MPTTLTPNEIVQIAKVSGYLAANDVAKGALFGHTLDPLLPQKIYAERYALEWALGISYTYESVQEVANYVYALCGRYALLAQRIIGGNAGGGVVVPGNPIISGFPIKITSADFVDATHYNNKSLIGKKLALYVNGIKYIFFGSGYTFTENGIQITTGEGAEFQDFDATQQQYEIVIERLY